MAMASLANVLKNQYGKILVLLIMFRESIYLVFFLVSINVVFASLGIMDKGVPAGYLTS
jgi:hypothetical protein